MTDDRIAGTARNLGGKVQEGYGKVAGDAVSEFKGKVNQAAGAAQDMYGQAADAVMDGASAMKESAADAADYVAKLVKERPYTVAVAAFFAGWVISHISAHRRDYY
jgi:uncharacterized protein YjbJ (UPF0337 family)